MPVGELLLDNLRLICLSVPSQVLLASSFPTLTPASKQVRPLRNVNMPILVVNGLCLHRLLLPVRPISLHLAPRMRELLIKILPLSAKSKAP